MFNTNLSMSFSRFRIWRYYKIHRMHKGEMSQVWMAAASSAAILFWVGTYTHLSSTMLSSSDPLVVERALAAQARISAKNFDFWRDKGVSMTQSKFLKQDPDGVFLDDIQAYRSNLLIRHSLPLKDVQVLPVHVNFNESDVLVMLHIQKTGGTSWDNHLVLNMDPGCNCQGMNERTRVECRCWNDRGQIWMINRNSVNWPCGLHASYTDMVTCLDSWFTAQRKENRSRKYRYMTILRDPITRFFSEWMNVRSGRTWMESRLHCDGRDATIEEVPWCFEGSRWVEPTLDEYFACSGNMGINRMTRMLANLSLSDCYRLDSNKTKSQRDEIMLASAKANLAQFTAFGLTEYPVETQALIEKSVTGMKFKGPLARDPDINFGTSYVIFSDEDWNRMVDINHLDVRLYQYAKDLFFQRLEAVGIPTPAGEFEAVRVPEDFKYKIVHVG